MKARKIKYENWSIFMMVVKEFWSDIKDCKYPSKVLRTFKNYFYSNKSSLHESVNIFETLSDIFDTSKDEKEMLERISELE